MVIILSIHQAAGTHIIHDEQKRRSMEFRDLGEQYKRNQRSIDAAIKRSVSSGRYIGGPEVRELEEALASYVGVEHCVTCANGTDALQLALMTWGIGPGDAVFVPDFTFFSSGEVVSAIGATPIFVDIDPRTFNIDPSSLEAAITYVMKETKLSAQAVIPVDLYGLPADYPALQDICKRFDLLMLEDAAQGFGSAIGKDKAGAFGDIGATSFFPAKPLGCYGDGGAVFTDDDEWAALLRSFAVHGKGSEKYDNVRIGMNSRLDTIQAAVLSAKLPVFMSHELDAVDQIAKLYSHGLQDIAKKTGILLPFIPDGYSSAWAQYTIQLPETLDQDAVQRTLAERDIPTMVYYPKPMHEQTAFEGRCLCPSGCPVTSRLCQTVLSLPMGPYMTESDVERVCAELQAAIANS